ncbi:MAG: DUF4954 family protein [Spirochaetes bacterium]|nr:DUF4954 family protein [Spirochaetota bacterium]
MIFQHKLSSSELIRSIESVKKRSKAIEKEVKALTKEQIDQLKKNNNYSSDWKKVKAAPSVNIEKIRNNIFSGKVFICSNKGKSSFKELSLEYGIYNSTLQDCVIDKDVLIKDVGLLKNYYTGANTLLMNSMMISADVKTDFGNGRIISVGMETGGRDIASYAELTVEEAQKLALSRNDKEFLKSYDAFISEYKKKIKCEKGIILDSAKVINNKAVINTFIGPHAVVSGCTLVRNCTILSNKEEVSVLEDGVYVKDSIIQWGVEVSSMGIVDNSVLTEHSHVLRHGKVTNSIIGPNSGIAEGEVTSSLLGPFVGFHHQSLMIAALWGEGKGNVGYGANVGSNHTSKAPDQEIFPGEGLFFGLGVNIKFPANFRKAPYTIIATGVRTLPQKVEFPFSLINTPAHILEEVSPAYNEIIPAWILSDNIYTIKRNEGKYIKRNKARRTQFQFEVFRPDIIDLMINARARLEDPKCIIKDIYFDKDIKGLGKNYLFEVNRIKAIDSYTFYIRYYALKGLMKRVREFARTSNNRITWNTIKDSSNEKRWQHEKNILFLEFGEKHNIKNLLDTFLEMETKIALDVSLSKEKDDTRGRKIIDDYDLSHISAKDDAFVRNMYNELDTIKKELAAIKKKVE